MKILILAAGYGTRLYSITQDTPKPLLPIHDKPLINYILDRIKNILGLNEVIVVTNNKFIRHFKQWAQQQSKFPSKIVIVNDGTQSPEQRLGSVGDINFVLNNHRLEDDLLIVGGDNLFDYNIDEYVEFSKKKSPYVTVGLYDINNIKEASQFGVVQLDKNKKVISFEEKPSNPKSSLIAMCFYYMPQETLNFVGEYLQSSQKSDKAGDYIKWLAEKKGVYGFIFQGKWYDIGSVESYREAQAAFKS